VNYLSENCDHLQSDFEVTVFGPGVVELVDVLIERVYRGWEMLMSPPLSM
jgi:hypothetical protein